MPGGVEARSLNAELAAALASGRLGAELVRVARVAAAVHRGEAVGQMGAAQGGRVPRSDGARKSA